MKRLGYVPKEDLPVLLSSADLFVYPSLYEGFGIPVIEAMACGVPVVASCTSSIPEVAGEAAILVDPYNVKGIASAMMRVLDSEKLRDDLIRRGLERAKVFSWSSSASRLKEIFYEEF